MQVLEPIWIRELSQNTHQSIKGRGIHMAKRKLEKVLRRNDDSLWCVKIDIKKFYPSINNDLLYDRVCRKLKCRRTCQLLQTIIYSTAGVPIGNYTSQYLGNLFLSDLDKSVEAMLGVVHYSRYCDDIVVLTRSKASGNKVMKMLSNRANELQLKIKQDKQVWKIGCRPIDFLGYILYSRYSKLRGSIKSGYCIAVGSKYTYKIMGYNGWLLVCNSFNLRKRKLDEIK